VGLSPERAGTWRFTVAALGLVLGISAAGVLPLLFPWQGQLALSLAAAGLAASPFVALSLVWRRRREAGVPVLTAAVLVTLAPVLALAPLFGVYRGQVRVLNHGDEPFWLWVDARRVARVDPSSGESALSGVELTVPAGERALRVVAVSDGRPLFHASVRVLGGSPHLFAPLSDGYCFSIERRGYGDEKRAVQAEPLVGASPFWVLPEGIAFFTPNPEAGRVLTSGGTLTCLRQKRCRN
jgi:hypothetical protein